MTTPGAPLRVMSFNIHHGVGVDHRLDLARIADVIDRSGADLAGLQEVDRHFAERSGFADQAGWLSDRLSMHVAYGPSLDLQPATPDLPRRQYGNALLSRFPIEVSHTTLLPPGDPVRAEDRSLLYARVVAPGDRLDIFVTHLHNGRSQGRLAQARAVREATHASPDPVILLGDFNATPDTAEVREISRGLVDTWRQAGAGSGHTFSTRRPRVRIDYVLVSAELRATSAAVLDTRASDHRPVLAELVSR